MIFLLLCLIVLLLLSETGTLGVWRIKHVVVSNMSRKVCKMKLG